LVHARHELSLRWVSGLRMLTPECCLMATSAWAVMSIGDGQFHKGQPVWVIGPDGSQRAADFVGEGEMNAWFGGSPTVIVVYLDTRNGEAVEVDRVIPREA
jgi:hypothetical protein